MSINEDYWTPERIAQLSRAEIQNLRSNAHALGSHVIVARCDTKLFKTKPLKRSGSRPASRRSSLVIVETTVDEVAKLIKALPPADAVPLAQERLRRLAMPVVTFSELWRQFIVCGFSSLEKSDPGTPLHAFARGGSSILDLASILERGEDPTWIADQLAQASLNRMTQKKRSLVSSARAAFVSAKGRDDSLVKGSAGDTGLKVFLDLASGRVNDHDLASSAAFSAAIDPGPFFGIGHKQIRNIMVNSGLARNVVPIDSRWQAFFGHLLEFSPADLSQRSHYLAIEDVLRSALLQVQRDRSDIPNLAVLDSVVFASQSPQGYGVSGWAGS